jgi:ACS family tartrate transporter-like MFS transporter
MPTQFFSGPAAAAGIALVTMIANIGSFAGPTLIGILKTHTGTHTGAFLLLGGMALISTLLALRIRAAPVQTSE